MKPEDEAIPKIKDWQEWLGMYSDLVCSCCGAPFAVIDGSWRWNGSQWEHKCQNIHAQCGHFVGVKKGQA